MLKLVENTILTNCQMSSGKTKLNLNTMSTILNIFYSQITVYADNLVKWCIFNIEVKKKKFFWL